MKSRRALIIGGGAAGFFAGIACAEAAPDASVEIVEQSSEFLSKVRISGGGRCNVTHHCFEPREFSQAYPRGSRALLSAFHRFQARDTVAWFEGRGIPLKAEKDGRMFPTTDTSETVVQGLIVAARQAGVTLRPNTPVTRLEQASDGSWLWGGSTPNVLERVDRVLIAIGGCRSLQSQKWLSSLGHTVESPVPSLFTFHVASPWLVALSGVSVSEVEVHALDLKIRSSGPLLITHWGLSGPAILKMSAWGARAMAQCEYRFRIALNWLPHQTEEALFALGQQLREQHPGKRVTNLPWAGLPARLWEQLVAQAGVAEETRYADLSRPALSRLIRQIRQTELEVSGKSLNKEEFVTCGGVSLKEVDFKTMESRVRSGLYFAGEVLDVDGITGGFNFQAAWTTGWLAGRAMAEALNAG